MKKILGLLIALIAAVVFNVHAQQNKERGDTDYTNNKTKGKGKDEKSVPAARSTPVKIIEYIPGTWVIEHVYRGKEDVTSTDTLASTETFEFNREGRYTSFSGTEKIDSGAYRINEEHAVLYLASEGDNEKPQEWNVWFDKDGTMTLKMLNSPNKGQDFSYVYRRNSTETTSNRKR
jgi:outer membrane protein assembly factor BamE (lipoprotein component of BamABCDE complex)